MAASAARTKIVCTLGPASSSPEMVRALIGAGMDVARLNFSHGTHEDHAQAIARLRAAAHESGEHVTLLQDLQGPKIRVGDLATPAVELVTGRRVTITTEQVRGTATRLSTTFAHLPADVAPGDPILMDDGRIRLRVVEAGGTEVLCEVMVGGRLLPHKGINLPGAAVSAPSYTDKDLDDLAFGIAHGVDYVALSFVRSAADLRALRAEIGARVPQGPPPLLVAKIEKPQAIDDIDAIIAASDAVMVARGDLGVEMLPEDVPMLQKMIIRKCNDAGRPVIVATQMLESMIANPTPTRAEANDVANAVLDGCDAVMLSGETSVGKYPAEAVALMNRIICKVESARGGMGGMHRQAGGAVRDRRDALGRAACSLAEQMGAAAIVAVTRSGETARVLARYRPEPPIIAVTVEPKVLCQLNLTWGVRGIVMTDLPDNSDEALLQIQRQLAAAGAVRPDEYVVLLAGQPFFAQGSTNFIKVERIG